MTIYKPGEAVGVGVGRAWLTCGIACGVGKVAVRA